MLADSTTKQPANSSCPTPFCTCGSPSDLMLCACSSCARVPERCPHSSLSLVTVDPTDAAADRCGARHRWTRWVCVRLTKQQAAREAREASSHSGSCSSTSAARQILQCSAQPGRAPASHQASSPPDTLRPVDVCVMCSCALQLLPSFTTTTCTHWRSSCTQTVAPSPIF